MGAMGRFPQTALRIGLLMVLGTNAAAPEPVLPRLHVRVYDSAELPESAWRRAEAVAADIFRQAGIETAWLVCPSGRKSRAVNPKCRAPMGSLGVVIRALPSAPHALSRRPHVLGRAHLPKGGGFARYADIYIDRVEGLADSIRSVLTGGAIGVHRAVPGSRWRILGMVAAHELGHLILNTNSHLGRGLMRERWGRPEVAKLFAGQLRFHHTQVGRLHAQLKARLNENPASEPLILASR